MSPKAKTTVTPALMSQVDKRLLLKALECVRPCVAKSDTPVAAFKCFRFNEGTVEAFNGLMGMVTSVPVMLGSFLVPAEAFQAYIKSSERDFVVMGISDNAVHVDAATFPKLLDEDFPESIIEDMEMQTTATNVADCITRVLPCIEKAAAKRNIPFAVLFRGSCVYGADGLRAARTYLDKPVRTTFLLPVDAAKIVAKLGNPLSVVSRGPKIGFMYDDCYFSARLIEGTGFGAEIDNMLVEMEARAKRCSVPVIERNLRRLEKLCNDDVLKVAFDGCYLSLSVRDQATGIYASDEELPWDGPAEGFEFKCSLSFLLEAISLDVFDFVDVGSLPKKLRFCAENYDLFMALHS